MIPPPVSVPIAPIRPSSVGAHPHGRRTAPHRSDWPIQSFQRFVRWIHPKSGSSSTARRKGVHQPTTAVADEHVVSRFNGWADQSKRPRIHRQGVSTPKTSAFPRDFFVTPGRTWGAFQGTSGAAGTRHHEKTPAPSPAIASPKRRDQHQHQHQQ